MTEHVLKTLTPYWDAVARGDKTFEVRRDDRGFQRGDILILRRLTPGYEKPDSTIVNGKYQYWDLRRRVSYVLPGGQFGVEVGYVVLGLVEID